MKRIVLVIGVLVLLAGRAHAESPTDKGVYSLLGSFSYSHIKNNSSSGATSSTATSNTFSLNPAGFYFIYPDLAIGAAILYYDSKSSGGLEFKDYGAGPVVRYYFGKEMVNPFISMEYLYTTDKIIYPSSSDRKLRGTDISLSIGVDYFLSKNVALEPIIRYTFSHTNVSYGTPGLSSRSEELLIGLGINVFIF